MKICREAILEKIVLSSIHGMAIVRIGHSVLLDASVHSACRGVKKVIKVGHRVLPDGLLEHSVE